MAFLTEMLGHAYGQRHAELGDALERIWNNERYSKRWRSVGGSVGRASPLA